jgi:hypothetical protein
MSAPRVATLEECARYGNTLPKGLRAPIAGGAGWSLATGQINATTASVAGTTGLSLAFGSNVTIGDVVVCCGVWPLSTTLTTVTFSDVATTTNVTSWTKLNGTVGYYSSNETTSIYIAFGIATRTGPCTPAWTNSATAGAGAEIYIAEFIPPSGTVSQDGTAGSSQAASGATSGAPVNIAATGTSGSNDLLINYASFGNSFSGFGGSWAQIGTENGDWCGYDLNVAGSTQANVYQGSTAAWASTIVALQTSGGAPSVPPDVVMAPPIAP